MSNALDAPARLLLTHSDAAERQYIAAFFEAEGYCVDQASNGYHAKTLLMIRRYDCAIIDLWQPGINGLELLRFMRSLPHKPRTVVVVGNEASGVENMALSLGAVACCHQPASPRDIFEHLRALSPMPR